MKKAEKQNNPNREIYCDVKLMLNVSVSKTIIRTLTSGKLFTQHGCLLKKQEQIKCIQQKDKNVHIVFLI